MHFFEKKWPAILLLPFSLIYGIISAIRNLLYDSGILKQHKIGCKVISIGNITVGGTGKTPTVIYLAKALKNKGYKIAVLSRGYGRTSKGTVVVSDGRQIFVDVNESGDEPQMIARRLKNIPVIVDENRVRGANKTIEFFKPDVLILDDAFQHRRIFRDINIVLFKRKSLWGNGFLLPAGPLRESPKALKRADIAWINIGELNELPNLKFAGLIVPAVMRPSQVVLFGGKKNSKPNNRCIAVSGIANPNRFHLSLQQLQMDIVKSIEFKDHHNFSTEDIESINKQAEDLGVDSIITTEKDFVKLEKFQQTQNKWAYLPIEIIPLNKQTLTHITQLLV